jgi:hypothetical protein
MEEPVGRALPPFGIPERFYRKGAKKVEKTALFW